MTVAASGFGRVVRMLTGTTQVACLNPQQATVVAPTGYEPLADCIERLCEQLAEVALAGPGMEFQPIGFVLVRKGLLKRSQEVKAIELYSHPMGRGVLAHALYYGTDGCLYCNKSGQLQAILPSQIATEVRQSVVNALKCRIGHYRPSAQV